MKQSTTYIAGKVLNLKDTEVRIDGAILNVGTLADLGVSLN